MKGGRDVGVLRGREEWIKGSREEGKRVERRKGERDEGWNEQGM